MCPLASQQKLSSRGQGDMLHLSDAQAHDLIQQAKSAQPAEICGLLVGQVMHDETRVVKQIIPIANIAENPQRHYEMDPIALLRTLKRIDAAELQLLGVYHSHPSSAPIPSQQDVHDAERNYPHVLHVLIGLQAQQISIQVWRIYDGIVHPVDLHIGKAADTSAPSPSEGLSRAQMIAILLAGILAVAALLVLSVNLLPAAPDIAEIIRGR